MIEKKVIFKQMHIEKSFSNRYTKGKKLFYKAHLKLKDFKNKKLDVLKCTLNQNVCIFNNNMITHVSH